jgi:transcriptional regulator with XRE-family HTH domain
MDNVVDLFAAELRAKRAAQTLTQEELADRLHMSKRTISEAERCKSSPRFETVALIAREMNISLDAIVFHNTPTATVSKSVVDFFAGKGEVEIQKYIAICKQIENLQEKK